MLVLMSADMPSRPPGRTHLAKASDSRKEVELSLLRVKQLVREGVVQGSKPITSVSGQTGNSMGVSQPFRRHQAAVDACQLASVGALVRSPPRDPSSDNNLVLHINRREDGGRRPHLRLVRAVTDHPEFAIAEGLG